MTRVDFKPTLMYAQRSFKFTIKNTSLINLQYNFKIANSLTGILDAGPYSIIPKKGSIAPVLMPGMELSAQSWNGIPSGL